jgi:CRP/FNR family transcriptional regulator
MMEGFNKESEDCRNCFKQSPPFQFLSKDELELLEGASTEVEFKKGEIIYKQGTPLTHMVIIHSGYGKIYMENSKERNLILCYTRPYDLNGGVGVFLDKRHHSTLMAVTDCATCFVDIAAFNEVIRSNEAFREAYLKDFSQRVQHIYYQFTVLTQKNMEGRMAESLLYLGDQIFAGGSIRYLSKQDLAELTAMTKESAIRVLKGFKDEGLIEMLDHTINVLDKKALEQITLYS